MSPCEKAVSEALTHGPQTIKALVTLGWSRQAVHQVLAKKFKAGELERTPIKTGRTGKPAYEYRYTVQVV